MAMGMRKYEGKADMVKALSILKGNDREQGSKHFYNSSDPFALSIMISDLTNKPASEIFYENAFKKFIAQFSLILSLVKCGGDFKTAIYSLFNSFKKISSKLIFYFVKKDKKVFTCLGSFM